MDRKNPISALQELMAAKKLALPKYLEEITTSGAFKCTVCAGGVVGTGSGSNKKTAKLASAKDALQKLGALTQCAPVYLEDTPCQKPLKNYVGELNEYSSRQGLKYPEYDLIMYPLVSEFLIKCTFLSHECIGRGSTKKDAKQDSARNMLKMIEKEYKNYKIIHLESTVETKNVDEIIAMYRNFSLKTANDISEKNVSLKPAPELKIDEEDSVEMLEAKLNSYGIEYTISDMQTNPFVLSLVIKDTEFTLIETGQTRVEALRKILQKVLLVKKSGCSFNTNLVNL